MAKNKSQLRTENSTNFPNNNSQFITPEKLRGFNNDMIDSLVVSSDTGSYVTTSSFDNSSRNLTFTKADGSTYVNNIPGGSGGATDTGSLLTTASVSDATITFTKGDASQFSIEVDNVTSSLQTQDVFVNVKNTSGSPINKGLAVHATGVTGENINVELADSTNSANMPAIGLLEETLANNATGRAIISGRLKNIDTSGLVAGASVYVNGAGTLTATQPTGSDEIQAIGVAGKINASEGEIIVQGAGRINALPNLTEGYIWVGDADHVPQEFSTGSIAFTNKNNTFTGTQNFTNISVSGTGSFGYIESVTGSAKIIGDAFIILNNDTPTERYAGIKVIDSGSSQATASLQFDGQTNDWFYEYTSSGDPDNFGIVLFGPEYNTIGNPTYLTSGIIPISDGGHHLEDSKLLQQGNGNIEYFTSAAPGQYNNIIINGDSTQGGGNFTSLLLKDNGVSGNNASLVLTTFDSYDNGNGAYNLEMGLSDGDNGRVVIGAYQDGTTRYYKPVTFTNSFTFDNEGTFANNVIIQGIVSSSNAISASAFSGDGSGLTGVALRDGQEIISGNIADGTFPIANSTYQLGDSNLSQTGGGSIEFFTNSSPGQYEQIVTTGDSTQGGGNFMGYVLKDAGVSGFEAYFALTTFDSEDSGNGVYQLGMGANNSTQGRVLFSVYQDGTTRCFRDMIFQSGTNTDFNSTTAFYETSSWEAPITSSQYISASAFIGDGSQLTGLPGGGIFEQTGSFYSTTNDLQVTGSFGVSKAIGGQNTTLTVSSDTASIDLTQGNTFTVTLLDSATVHLDVSTFGEEAQSINVLVKQPSSGNTGSISFSPDFKFGQGAEFLPTTALNAEDIISFTRFGNSLYGTFINNFN